MRSGLLIIVIPIGIAMCLGLLARVYGDAASAALSEDARIAIEVRCGIEHDRAARDCRSLLKKLYRSGSLDPDKTLRTYCDRVKNALWGGSRPAQPEVCLKRYGRWQS